MPINISAAIGRASSRVMTFLSLTVAAGDIQLLFQGVQIIFTALLSTTEYEFLLKSQYLVCSSTKSSVVVVILLLQNNTPALSIIGAVLLHW